jgi:hypothetical protein
MIFAKIGKGAGRKKDNGLKILTDVKKTHLYIPFLNRYLLNT